jgi:predicted amidohydrolase
MAEVRKKGARTIKVRVGAVQMISTVGDVEGNIEKALSYCDKAAERGVEILCFPECASTGFDWVQNKVPMEEVYAEPVPGPMVEKFAEKSRMNDLYIIFGMVERPKRSKKIYNTAFLVGPDEGYLGKYRKVLSEKVFEDGSEVDVFDTRFGKIGIFICADMRSPEISRLLVVKGASILFQPTNYFHPDGIDIKRRYMGKCTAQRTRAMDNGVHLVIANAGRNEYVNNSRIISPYGQGPEPRLAYATRKEQLLTADIEYDPEANPVVRLARSKSWLFRELGEQMLKFSFPKGKKR